MPSFFARVVGEYAVPVLAFDDSVAARDTLAGLEAVPHVEAAFLFDTEGELFASWGVGTAVPTALEQGVTVEAEGILVTEPIDYRGERFGTIILRLSSDPLRERIKRHLLILFVALVVVVGIGILASYWLQRPISEPILELASAMRRVSLTGDYSLRFETANRDEIGTLYAGFNEMLSKVLAREQERDQAEFRTREKSRFLANMSHELRTPLNSIIGFSEVLLTKTEGLDPKQARFLEHIHTSGQHLLSLINEILDLSKVEAGRVEIHPEPIGLEALLEGVGAVMRGAAGRRGIEISFEFPTSLPVIWVDPIKTKQMFYNLLSNAVKFSSDGGSVEIKARAVGISESPLGEAAVEVTITDHGIGISKPDQERIFAEFVQVDESVGRRFEGTGLGLALVRAFVGMHDGKVWVESQIAEGSTFHVVLPIRYLARMDRSVEGKAATVVVADGDPESAGRWTSELFQSRLFGFPARTRSAVLGLVRSRKPAAVAVLLGNDDHLDGWGVLESLERDPKTRDTPVVICCLGERGQEAVSLSADAYFTEPLDLKRLRERVTELTPGLSDAGAILIVDDDPQVHEVLGEPLEELGHSVVHAWSAKEASEHLEHSPPGLLVIDLFMGDMEGFQVAFDATALGRHVAPPILLVARKEVSQENRLALRKLVSESRLRGDVVESLARSLKRLLLRTTGELPTLRIASKDE